MLYLLMRLYQAVYEMLEGFHRYHHRELIDQVVGGKTPESRVHGAISLCMSGYREARAAVQEAHREEVDPWVAWMFDNTIRASLQCEVETGGQRALLDYLEKLIHRTA